MATPSSPEVTLSLSDGGTRLTLGTIIASSPRPVSRQLTARNHTARSLHVQLTLSDDLCGLITLADFFDDSVKDLEPAGANLNLLHAPTGHVPELSLPPFTAVTVTLRFVAAGHTASSPHAVHDEAPFAGTLDVRQTHGAIVSSLPVSGKLCSSLLRPDALRLDYGHCARSSWTYRELSVRNLSSVATQFCLSPGLRVRANSACGTSLCFTDADTGAALDTTAIDVPVGGARRIRVGLFPETAAKEERWFSVENLHNPADLWHVRVYAGARADRVAQSIDVDCGGELEFGDCYAHCRTFRDVVLSSKCDDNVTVALLSDRRHQIVYEVLQDWPFEPNDELNSALARSLDAATRHLDAVSVHRTHEFIERPLSPLTRGPAAAVHVSVEDLSQNRDRTKRKSSSSLFTQKSHLDSVDQVKQISSVLKNRMGEIVTLAPGQRRVVRVWYLPLTVTDEGESGSEAASDLDRGRLCSDSFQLIFKLPSGESRVIEGRSRVCESILRLERNEVHLGDCNVLTKYKSVLTVINCSDLPAYATINYVSQCVVADAHEVHIEPRATFDLVLNFVPRQVSPDYHKEITVTNRRSLQLPNMIFVLRANVIDRQGISLHALFYKVLAPNQTNEIDFGVTVANHPAIRAFRVRNITQSKLVLQFNSGQGVKTYVPSKVGSISALGMQKLGSHKELSGLPDYNVSAVACMPNIYQDHRNRETLRAVNALVDGQIRVRDGNPSQLAYTERRREHGHQVCELEWNAKSDFQFEGSGSDEEQTDFDENGDYFALGGERSWLEFLKCLSERDFALLDSIPMFFSNHDSEIGYTERQFRPARRLRAALRDGYVSETNALSLGPEAESLVVVSLVLTDFEVRGKTKIRPFEKKLTVQMLEFDDTILSDAAPTSSKEFNQIARLFENDRGSMPREILLTVQACKSRMKIAPLRQLNFGTILCGEQKDKAFTIVNLSEAPLLYELRKEGLETADELRFNLGKGTRGVVRPYFSKVVPFIYAPTSEGFFEERIIVENRLDKSASCELVVKAMVTAPPSRTKELQAS